MNQNCGKDAAPPRNAAIEPAPIGGGGGGGGKGRAGGKHRAELVWEEEGEHGGLEEENGLKQTRRKNRSRKGALTRTKEKRKQQGCV